MKLSQIRLLSWSLALLGAGFCAMYGLKAYKALKATKPQSVAMVEFVMTGEAVDISREHAMENKRLMDALSYLTKVPPPPPPPPKPAKIKTPPPKPVKTTAPPPKKVEPPFDPKLTVTLISYDDVNGRHLAFIKKEKEHSHPYLVNEKIKSTPVTILKEIHRAHVVVETEDGKKSKTLFTSQSSVKVLKSGPKIQPVGQRVVTNPNGAKKLITAPPKTRRVPRSRSVKVNKDYGISVVEYDRTPDGEQRFAINKNDLNTLNKQALRLMSEVDLQPAYDANGNPVGIRIGFMADNPLAKQYGVQADDVITHVNDERVTDVHQAENLYNGLSEKQRVVRVVIDRKGVPIIINYEMDDFPGVPNRNK